MTPTSGKYLSPSDDHSMAVTLRCPSNIRHQPNKSHIAPPQPVVHQKNTESRIQIIKAVQTRPQQILQFITHFVEQKTIMLFLRAALGMLLNIRIIELEM